MLVITHHVYIRSMTIPVLACIIGCLSVLTFLLIQRGKPIKYGNALILILSVSAFTFWVLSVGFERAIAVWFVQIMATGVILSTVFAITDAQQSRQPK